MNASSTNTNNYVTIVSDQHWVGGGYSVQQITQNEKVGTQFFRCYWHNQNLFLTRKRDTRINLDNKTGGSYVPGKP